MDQSRVGGELVEDRPDVGRAPTTGRAGDPRTSGDGTRGGGSDDGRSGVGHPCTTLREHWDSDGSAPPYRWRMLFDVRVLRRGGWTVVSVVGDVDLATMPTLHQELSGVDGDRVALDLSGVDHLDPVTFGVLVAAALRAGRGDGPFAVVAPPGRPRELLAESRLDQVLTVAGSPDDLA